MSKTKGEMQQHAGVAGRGNLNDLREILDALIGDARPAIVNLTASTLTIEEGLHNGKTILQDRAAGSTITLPAATGSGLRVRIIIKTTITSNDVTIQVANANDTMFGSAWLAQDGADTVVEFDAGASDDTITLNGSTTGGIRGDIIDLEDVAENEWHAKIMGSASGIEATPFSAAV